jgi:hypothetical protein
VCEKARLTQGDMIFFECLGVCMTSQPTSCIVRQRAQLSAYATRWEAAMGPIGVLASHKAICNIPPTAA